MTALVRTIVQITREQMLALPRPTSQQWDAFAAFLPEAHSWYKFSLVQGATFVVFMSPDAGGDWTDERPLGGTSWKTTQHYRALYGHLDFMWTYEGVTRREGNEDPVELPDDLIRRCSFTLYPWGAADGAGLEVICGGYHEEVYDDWTRLHSEAPHPAKERLFVLRDLKAREDELWNALSDDERELAVRTEDALLLERVDHPAIRDWFEAQEQCHKRYLELGEEEAAKVPHALRELRGWLDDK